MAFSAYQADFDGSGLAIGVVCSRFNEPVCEVLLTACLAELERLGVARERIVVCSVPGALEIPQVLARMAGSDRFDALIALGAVIRGETYHFEVVSNEASRGIQTVSIESRIPVANAVLTTNTDEQAQVRAAVKGAEAAQVAVEMARLGVWLDATGAGLAGRRSAEP
jgi:6,7-dimethyl-8-ribityllumazine synthase